MKSKILWIDDDYFLIGGLFRPIEKEGFEVITANSAMEGYRKLQQRDMYSLIVIDLAIPISDQQESIPDTVKAWEKEAFIGIGLIKWLLDEVGSTCPVIILSTVRDPISTYDLGKLELAGYIAKSGLLPSKLRDSLLDVFQQGKNNSHS